jgi:hypothetical protein
MRLFFADIHFSSAMHTSPDSLRSLYHKAKRLSIRPSEHLLQHLFETIFIFLIDSLFNADVACKGSDNKFYYFTFR